MMYFNNTMTYGNAQGNSKALCSFLQPCEPKLQQKTTTEDIHPMYTPELSIERTPRPVLRVVACQVVPWLQGRSTDFSTYFPLRHDRVMPPSPSEQQIQPHTSWWPQTMRLSVVRALGIHRCSFDASSMPNWQDPVSGSSEIEADELPEVADLGIVVSNRHLCNDSHEPTPPRNRLAFISQNNEKNSLLMLITLTNIVMFW